MTLQEKADIIMDRLEELYPDAVCSLEYEKPYELLIATRLSAQCTDARVNIVTKDLFKRFPTLSSFASAKVEEIEEMIRPCGLFRTKAKSIYELANVLIDKFGGELPDNMDDLTSLPGIGRKTANLIMGDVYKKPAIVTDTHCIRICNRLGLSQGDDPKKVETQLWQVLDPLRSSDFCHRIVHFGRDVCRARTPKCDECPLFDMCDFKNK
ncbi:MAG: endonuclease III [Oscillospiraceae bacterium]|nr:endonuclease III [Oscillospiraceae bacterium]